MRLDNCTKTLQINLQPTRLELLLAFVLINLAGALALKIETKNYVIIVEST